MGFPRSSVGKESACKAEDPGSSPVSGKSPGEGNGNPLQYSCLENPMDRGAWEAPDHGVSGVRHNLVTKPPPRSELLVKMHYCLLRWERLEKRVCLGIWGGSTKYSFFFFFFYRLYSL